MSRSLIKILSIIMMTLVLTTCKPSPIEEGEGTTGQDDGYIMLVFNEKKSANRDTSPTSPDSDTESALSHLDVMMYKYNENNYPYEPFYHERVDVTQYPDGTAYLKRKKDDFEPYAKYKIYVVANSTHSESVFKPEGTAVISHENLMKLDQTDEYIHLSGIKGGNNIYPQYFLMDGVAYMEYATCNGQQCVKQGSIKYVGWPITCAHHMVKVSINGKNEGGVDIVT